jgi:transposase
MIIDLPARPGLRILVASRPIDFRRGMDSLSTLVKETLAIDPYAGDVFVFRAKRADRLKILVRDGSGLVLLSKRLERGRFTWPPVQDGAITSSAAQLTLLFSGVAPQPHNRHVMIQSVHATRLALLLLLVAGVGWVLTHKDLLG